jgi:glycosyltransferase involved in cell wall biosynthesis
MRPTLIFIAGKDPLEQRGGHSSYVRAHARAACKLGFHPHLFCASRRSGVVHADYGTIHRVASPFRPFRSAMAPLQSPLISACVAKFLRAKSGRFLVHSFGLNWGAVGAGLDRRRSRHGLELIPIVSAYTTAEHEILAKLRGIRAAHGRLLGAQYQAEHIWLRLAVERRERQSYLGSRLVLVNYEHVRNLIMGRYGIGAPFAKIPYTSESAFLGAGGDRPAPVPASVLRLRPADAPLVVAVSRQDPRKGVDVLLHALAHLRRANVPFRACLIGGGALLAAHRSLASRLALTGQAVLEGFVPDPVAYLRQADVFVLPSLQEGSGSVSLIEALQTGLPVVASNLDGIPEDIVDGDNGLLTPPGDAAALANVLACVLTNPALRQALAHRARQLFVTRFSPNAFVDALGNTYRQLGFAA